ncbi:PepSY domain-containing protein [Alkalibacillus almallahensis]|uniref:PepSY domain-containing protein n=1 Tax=Alkalibacillus almallahensis TaxID=1379154 RepID=UPI00141DB2EF|nr:PepSY domain-containing protein [Alkalibacillus almallahensis]NIK13270.1 putative membrane protein YkoI [Alkalibacillus almallahensis]
MRKTILYSTFAGTFMFGTIFGITNETQHSEADVAKAEDDQMNPALLSQSELQNIINQYMQGTIEEVTLNEYNEFEVTVNQDDETFDVLIDGRNGYVKHLYRREEQPSHSLTATGTTIEQLDAIELALETVNGEPKRVDLTQNNGKWVYQVIVRYDEKDFHVIVDAYTGVVLDVNS